jgi:secretion/DNA translocation related TadE-like protein
VVDDRGAGSVLAVAIVAAMVCVAAILIPLYAVLAHKQAVGGAADAAALAAADVRVGILPGEPCAVAARVASANGFDLGSCRLDGLVVTVTVRTSVAGFPLGATATAGPPHDGARSAHR